MIDDEVEIRYDSSLIASLTLSNIYPLLKPPKSIMTS